MGEAIGRAYAERLVARWSIGIAVAEAKQCVGREARASRARCRFSGEAAAGRDRSRLPDLGGGAQLRAVSAGGASDLRRLNRSSLVMEARRPRSRDTDWFHERELLGVLIRLGESGALSGDPLTRLSASDFGGPHAAAVFATLREMLSRSHAIDRSELVDVLVNRHGAHRSEAVDYVNALLADAPVQPHLGERIRRVREAARRRRAET